jgi:hypothetical protein
LHVGIAHTLPQLPQFIGSLSSAVQQPAVGSPVGRNMTVDWKLAPQGQPQQPQFVGLLMSNSTVCVSNPGAEIVAV